MSSIANQNMDKSLRPRPNYDSCFFAHRFPAVPPRSEMDTEVLIIKEAVQEFLGHWSMKIFQTNEPGAWLFERIVEGILETPFGLYENISQQPNVLIEAGFALGKAKPAFLIVRTLHGRPDPDVPSDLSSLIQVRYEKSSAGLLKALTDAIPIRYLSPGRRFRTLLESSTELQRALLAFILQYSSRPAHRIAGEMSALGYLCSNQELMAFFRTFEEFLEFEGSAEQPDFMDLRIPRVFPEYREILRTQPELRDLLVTVRRLGQRIP